MIWQTSVKALGIIKLIYTFCLDTLNKKGSKTKYHSQKYINQTAFKVTYLGYILDAPMSGESVDLYQLVEYLLKTNSINL